MNIPDSTSVAAYDVAKRVYEGSLTREAGLSSLTAAHSMNRNSAADYLGIFSCMVEGRRYTRTSNAFATDYYLTQIHKHYGADGLRNALTALCLHLDYYEGLRKRLSRRFGAFRRSMLPSSNTMALQCSRTKCLTPSHWLKALSIDELRGHLRNNRGSSRRKFGRT